jgi:cyclophilin family peptidyl-prolyl cis-trans isomerase
VVQGGGFLSGLVKKAGVRAPIVNEFSPDRSNVAGTVAMAKLGDDPDSATSQFFFNLADNSENLDNQNGGFTVFARVIEGMNVVNDMGQVVTSTRQLPDGGSLENVPAEDIILQSATIEGTPPPEDFITTASGLKYKDEVVGTGDLVLPDSTIKVLYTGRLTDENGNIFDSRLDPNDPAQFGLNSLIQGWKEGLGEIEMHAGGKRILIIPPELGYGSTDKPNIPANSTLWFEIEVLEVVPP